MKDFKAFLLSSEGWQDGMGNTVVFSRENLMGETTENKIWLFLDEGLRCGGMHRAFVPIPEALQEMLCGVGKEALWKAIEEDWKKEDAICFLKD